MSLSIQNLTVRRQGCPVVDAVTLDIGPNECVGLIGPNGAGKTSLMRAMLGLLPFEGVSSLAAMPEKDRAKTAAWMPQQRDIAWPICVEDLIALGRIPFLARGQKLSDIDRAAVDAAIAHMGLEAFRTRPATELSGGEQARVLIARALAQDTPYLMADEPIAGLDPANQIGAMQVFAGLSKGGKGVLVSLHDLGLAARHCTRLVMMHQGRVVADGAPATVLTEANLRTVFGVTAHMFEGPQGLVFQPLDIVT